MDLSSLLNLAKSASDNKDAIAKGAKSVAEMFGKSSKRQSEDSSTKSSSDSSEGIYSPALERMISMALEDGSIDDGDMEILLKRAEKEGVDPDEFKMELRMRIKRQAKEAEKARTDNPVEALSKAFRAIEERVTGGKNVVDGGALTAALSLIPGVGQVAAIGSLAASFIESPSNRNELKAEIIRLFIIPDNEEYLQQFISYAASQLTEECNKSKEKKNSIKGMISSLTMGGELDIVPIWESKLEEACAKAMHAHPSNALLIDTARKHRPTLANKLRNGLMSIMDLEDYQGPMPTDAADLVDIVEMLYDKKQSDSLDWETLKPIHARFYSRAESIVGKDSPLYSRLVRCRIKRFGIF